MIYKFLKRYLESFAALVALIVFSPIIIVTTILLAIQNNGKPFFYQRRPGKDQKPFYIMKFKSMTDAKDADGNLLPDNQRITKLGALVRKTSIDEIPQLFNVLKGDMGIIGPRPLLFKYIPLYNEEQLRRHEVRPGMTGWAQINGRNSISWADKFKLDVYYVDNVSLLLDIRIFFMSFMRIAKKQGVNQSDERPMEPFNGNN
ncbi:MAG: lipid carrier--UDP-N-acetylgalactosaminyltransferase [Flavobacterium sp. BFFFF1]|uniref:sugar transferase n=1 Tax=unclassified Flavobacterium TaxID=196869 RepID=UPI000BD640FB|nr:MULTISPECIES: sugar transferase [unclassified Flavobacterium]OYU81511.1 MAG: lipid carrier--UDP-N-acetylgalactosaminyltransferase [Flavobacterium sp. BFFFF1]